MQNNTVINWPLEKIIEREQYDFSDFQDPRIPKNNKSWLNARTNLARQVIRNLRRSGYVIPEHGSEFTIACAAPFRCSKTVSATEMKEVVIKMAEIFAKNKPVESEQKAS